MVSHQHPAFLLRDDREFRLADAGVVAPLALPNRALGPETIGVDAAAADRAIMLLLLRTHLPRGIQRQRYYYLDWTTTMVAQMDLGLQKVLLL